MGVPVVLAKMKDIGSFGYNHAEETKEGAKISFATKMIFVHLTDIDKYNKGVHCDVLFDCENSRRWRESSD
jgi:hypothetical protein